MFLDFRREVVRISHEGGIKYHGGDAGMSLLFGVSGDCWRGWGGLEGEEIWIMKSFKF